MDETNHRIVVLVKLDLMEILEAHPVRVQVQGQVFQVEVFQGRHQPHHQAVSIAHHLEDDHRLLALLAVDRDNT